MTLNFRKSDGMSGFSPFERENFYKRSAYSSTALIDICLFQGLG